VVGWSNTGVATLTNVEVLGTLPAAYGPEQTNNCLQCFENNGFPSLGPGSLVTSQTCGMFTCGNTAIGFTGYLCDGTYQYNHTYQNGDTVCASWIAPYSINNGWYNSGSCCFQVHNPSTTDNLSIDVLECGLATNTLVLSPGSDSVCLISAKVSDITNPNRFTYLGRADC
jgi:hypothetical protein